MKPLALAALLGLFIAACATAPQGPDEWTDTVLFATVARDCQHRAPGCYTDGSGCWGEAWWVVMLTDAGRRLRIGVPPSACGLLREGDRVQIKGLRKRGEFRPLEIRREGAKETQPLVSGAEA